jgi:hypothetical protein
MFANLNGDEQILQFVRRFGLLQTNEARTTRNLRGERWSWWRQEIIEMSAAIQVWELIRSGDEHTLRSFLRIHTVEGTQVFRLVYLPNEADRRLRVPEQEGEEVGIVVAEKKNETHGVEAGDLVRYARVGLKKLIDAHLAQKFSIQAILDDDGVGLTLHYVPTDLLACLWLQFVHGVTNGLEYRQCQACDVWFELSPETARVSRLSCSDACKARSYREKQDQARRLFADKKSFRQIAKEVGSDVATVKGWITGKKE